MPYTAGMTTLQDFKARLTLGARCMFTAHWCPTPTLRTITKVQTASVAISHPFKGPWHDSWLTMPKASEVTSPAPGVFVISFADRPHRALTYDFSNVPALV